MTMRRGAVLKGCLLSGLGLILVWQVVRQSLAAALATVNPELAYTLNPRHPAVLSELAIQRFAAAQSARAAALPSAKPGAPSPTVPKMPEGVIAPIQDLAQRALLGDPINPRTLSLLGQLADEAGDRARAKTFMSLAMGQSRQETIAVLWLFVDATKARAFEPATGYADVLLRTRPELEALVVPILAHIAEDPAGFDSLQRILASAPPWRALFFRRLSGQNADWLMPMRLLLPLRDSGSPPEASEYTPYLKYLIQNKHADNAYYTWLQLLDPEQLRTMRLVYNGGFETPLSGVPFDWTIKQGAGVNIDITDGPEVIGKRALRIEFKVGRAKFGGVEQILVLEPGTYRLAGKVRGEFVGQRGLQWQISCLSNPTEPLASTPMFLGRARTWQDFTATVQIPDADCDGQSLTLVLAARSASEQLVSGTVWYDELSLEVAP